jgi:ABC-type phosphate transport system substrate-binding protein
VEVGREIWISLEIHLSREFSMKAKCRSLGLLVVVVASFLAITGAGASSASASVCVSALATKEAVYKERTTGGECTGTVEANHIGFVKVEEEEGTVVGKETESIYCFKTAAASESTWDSGCTTENKGAGGYVKAKTACRRLTLITGEGSSLQKTAQLSVWIPGSNCAVLYNSKSSGVGREKWGIEQEKHHPKDGTGKNPAESGDTFIASDEPLDTKQLSNLDEAAGAGEGGKGQALVIPVEQAAVAVIVNPPNNCTITEITNESLKKVWNLETVEWGGVSKATGSGCSGQKITRDVRKEGSGTTFVFKTYLKEIQNATCSGKTWEFYRETTHNLEWPEPGEGTCSASGLKAVPAAKEGGGGEVEQVVNTTGAIGYANLADARAQYNLSKAPNYHWVKVQNQRQANLFEYPGSPTSSEPTATSGESNCGKTHYSNATSITVGADDNWFSVNGAHPGSGSESNEHYPICTLTYDVGLVNYGLAEDSTNLLGGLATEQYLEYVVAPATEEGGQKALAKHDYREVEEAVGEFAQEEARLIAGVNAAWTKVGEKPELKFTKGTKETKTVTYTNTGSEPWIVAEMTITGSHPSSYNVVKDECKSKTIKKGESCKLEIEYIGKEGTESAEQGAAITLRRAQRIKLD